MSATVFRRTQYSTTVAAQQINPKDFEDTLVCHYSIPALQTTGLPIEESASDIASNKLLLAGNEILISRLNPHKNCVAIVQPDDKPIFASTEFVAFTPTNIEARFLCYSYQSQEVTQRLAALSESATRSHARVNPSDIIKFKIHQPPVNEQTIVSDYLDRETDQIDSLVAEKERMLELLEHKRAALISRAVTRGLDPKAPTKPSGLDWLGEIPKHWHVMRAKGLFHEVDDRTEIGEEELLSLRMHVGLVPHHDVSDKELEPKDVIGFKKVKVGQLVINRMRASMGLIAISPSDGIVSPDYAVFDIVHDIHIPYFLALFNTGVVGALFRSSSKGIGTGSQGFLRLYTENFLAIHFPVPPINVQERIVKRLDDERARTGILEAALMESIKLLRERRSALITAAVTGRIPMEEMTA